VKKIIRQKLIELVKTHPGIQERLMRFVKDARDETTIYHPYIFTERPRYGFSLPRHEKLYEIIDEKRDVYRDHLHRFLEYEDNFAQIPVQAGPEDPITPAWMNGWLPCSDAVALYGFLCLNNPRRYFEIGSGNSTKFARKAIQDHGLRTRVLSIDPQPRAEIDLICDQCVRQPLQEVDLQLFDELEEGDILFIDSSHCVYMNSDVTVAFLEILPRLKSGVFVEFHDIFLPYDYPAELKQTYISEQYLLASYLLSGHSPVEILLPNAFITADTELSNISSPLWARLKEGNKQVTDDGLQLKLAGSFWMRMK
jgi:hypothetical protein